MTATLPQQSDQELIRRAQDGNADAFGELYTRYVDMVFRYVFSKVGDPYDAEDLTEEIFFRVWRALPAYEQRGLPFTAFVMRVARNIVIDHYRRGRQKVEHVSLDDYAWSLSQPDAAVSLAELDVLRSGLKDLKEDYQQVLLLRFLSGLTPAETAQVMERSEGAIRVLQHRALQALRKKIEGIL